MRTPLPTDFSPPSGEFGLSAAVMSEPTEVLQGPFPLDRLASRLDDSVQNLQLPTIPGYELLNQIGAGGMGVVYRARHVELDRIVAIKVLTRESMLDRESHERFHREATAVAKLQHPNIIQVFGVGTYPVRGGSIVRQPYLSLEYVAGGSLIWHTRNPQPYKTVAKLMETIARAVHAAHEQGVVHRDLKPGNVLLTPDGTPKIADFGLAKSIDTFQGNDDEALTQVGVLIGTPEYMSPEQVHGTDNQPSVDIYALGIMLYELLTARVPFKGETSAETLLLLQSQEPLSPSKLQPNLPSDLETICLKCLEKTPAKRYSTALDLAEDLARWQRHEAIMARPVSSMERVYRWALRNRMMAFLIGLVIFGTLGAFIALLIAYGIAEQNTKLARKAEAEAESRRQAERHVLYRASCLVASAGLQVHNITMVKQALSDAPKECRGWEWHFYQSQLDRSSEVLYPSIESEVFRRTNGGDYFCIGRWQTDLMFVNMRTKKILRHENQRMDPNKVLVSRDFGRTKYAMRFENGPVEIRDLETGQVTARINCGDVRIEQLCVSEDDRSLTVQMKSEIQFWDLEQGRQVKKHVFDKNWTVSLNCMSSDHAKALLTIVINNPKLDREIRHGIYHRDEERLLTLPETQHNLEHSVFNHDGTRLFTSCQHPNMNMRLWDTATGQIVAKMHGHTNRILTGRFSPDNRTLVTGSMDHTLFFWDGETGAQRQHIRTHRGSITDLDFNKEGSRLAVSSDDQTISLLDVATGTETARLLGHEAAVSHVAFTPDSNSLISCSHTGKLLIWDSRQIEKENGLRGHTNFVYSVDYHPTKPWIISSSWDGTVRVWDTNKGETLSTHLIEAQGIIGHVRFHPDGKRYITLSRRQSSMKGNIRLFDLDSHKLLHEWEISCDIWRDGRGSFSPDGRYFTAGGRRITTIDLESPAQSPLPVPLDNRMVHDVLYTRDGQTLISAHADLETECQLKLWNAATKTEIPLNLAELVGEEFTRLALHPNRNLLFAATIHGKIYLVDLDTRTVEGTIQNGVRVYDMTLTPDGSRLVMACSNNLIRLWETSSLNLITELNGHSDYVHSLAFSPDGEILVSGSGDATIRIWRSTPKTSP